MKLIGFCGNMGSGKSTAIARLKIMQSTHVHNVKFAQPLYDIQESIYNRIESAYQRPEGFVKDRKLLQWLGTDWGRETISPTIWIDLWKAKVKELSGVDVIVVCDDVRFDNEADAVRALGGTVVKLVSDKSEGRAVGGVGITGHASEGGVGSHLVDYILPNNGTVQDLEDSLNQMNFMEEIW